MILGLHSIFFSTNLKAATSIITFDFALFASDSLRSPTGSAGQAAQQLSNLITASSDVQ
jgi:hypothetical protein